MKFFRFTTHVAFYGLLYVMLCSTCAAMQVETGDKNIICIGQKVAAHQAWRSTNLADQQNIATIINGTAKDLGLFFKIRNQLKTRTTTNNQEIEELFTNIVHPAIRRKAAHLLQKAGIPRPVTLKNQALKVLEERITTFAMLTQWSDLAAAEKILQEILYSPIQQPAKKQQIGIAKSGNYLYQAVIAVANDPTQTEELEDLEAKLKEVHKDFVKKTGDTAFEFSDKTVDIEPDWLEKLIERLHSKAREPQKKK
jgi:hypothetical protein